jgi:hypothetical protein
VFKCSLHYSVRLDLQSPVPNLTHHYLVAKVSWDLQNSPQGNISAVFLTLRWWSQVLLLEEPALSLGFLGLASVKVGLCTPALTHPQSYLW